MERRTWAAVAALTVVAFAVRLAQLHQSLFGDELFLYRIVAGHGLGQVLSLVHDTESTPPLHFVLAWLGAKVGDASVGMRIPSLVAGTATVPATFALGRRSVGDGPALFGAAIVAIAPFAIFYGVEGRAYSTLGLLAALSTLALLRALDRGRRRDWALFAALTLAVLYTHYVGVFVVVAHGAWVASRRRDRLRALAFAYAAAALGYAPWIPSFLVQRRDSAAVRIEHAYALTPRSVARAFLQVLPGHPYFKLDSFPGPAVVAAFVVAVGAAGVAAVLALRRRAAPAGVADRRAIELLAVVALATPVGAILYSLGPESVFLPRNMIPSLPAAALLLGAAVFAAGRTGAAVIGAVLLALLAVGAARTFEADFQRPPYRAAARYVEAHGRPGDAVLDVVVDPTTLGSALRVQLDRDFIVAHAGHTGTASTVARGRARGRLFLVVPQVGVLRGIPHVPALRGFRLVRAHPLRGLADLTVFTYAYP
jgi:mannosyltransferase